MQHEMSLSPLAYEYIETSKQRTEARLFDEKRQKIQPGDTIIFYRLPEKAESMLKTVVGISHFLSFGEMFTMLGIEMFGYEGNVSPDEAAFNMRQYYSEEEEKRWGVVGIHLR